LRCGWYDWLASTRQRRSDVFCRKFKSRDVAQFAKAGLIDEYQIMIDSFAIGGGTPLFNNITQQLKLKLRSARTFKSGVVLLCYIPE
jgi:hypothetical protein